tara:strand:+ start:481 stop:963 length:483 start_codon:yes stop_codon:yes gene_type:complete
MAELAVGNFVKFTSGTTTHFRFQNFFIGETITNDSEPYDFVPFGYSGVTINRTGDGTSAEIVLPNSTENVGVLTRQFSQDAIAGRWLAYVRVLIVDPDDKTSFTTLSNYYGQVTKGAWDNSTIRLNLSSVLDCVSTDIPQRKINQALVGNLPTTSGVRLQ